MSSDEETLGGREPFGMSEEDLDNEFNPTLKRRRQTKEEALYGVFAEDMGLDDRQQQRGGDGRRGGAGAQVNFVAARGRGANSNDDDQGQLSDADDDAVVARLLDDEEQRKRKAPGKNAGQRHRPPQQQQQEQQQQQQPNDWEQQNPKRQPPEKRQWQRLHMQGQRQPAQARATTCMIFGVQMPTVLPSRWTPCLPPTACVSSRPPSRPQSTTKSQRWSRLPR
eukprot:m.316030 g.316030  ORF g.316030 m.316030 type:complete len:223 (+) comp19677_c5_seq22:4206-4874(+)